MLRYGLLTLLLLSVTGTQMLRGGGARGGVGGSSGWSGGARTGAYRPVTTRTTITHNNPTRVYHHNRGYHHGYQPGFGTGLMLGHAMGGGHHHYHGGGYAGHYDDVPMRRSSYSDFWHWFWGVFFLVLLIVLVCCLLSGPSKHTSYDDVTVVPGGTTTTVIEETRYEPVAEHAETKTRFARWAKERENMLTGNAPAMCSGKRELKISYHDEHGNNTNNYGFMVFNFVDSTFSGHGSDPDGDFTVQGGRASATQLKWRAVMKDDPSIMAEFSGNLIAPKRYKCEFLVNQGISGSAILQFQ